MKRVFRFWTGDDTDATIVIDGAGDLYVASEYQRFSERSDEVGQLMKLDPSRPSDPLVWSIDAREIGFEGAGGSWSTPALYGDLVFFTTAAGRVLAVERETGDIRWERQVGAPAIGSPVVVDGVLIQGDCGGDLWAWDVSAAGCGSGAPLEAALQRLHRVDARGLARLDLPRHPPGVPLRTHRASDRRGGNLAEARCSTGQDRIRIVGSALICAVRKATNAIAASSSATSPAVA